MQPPWDEMESAGIPVYAADPSTYQLAYLNRCGRERFGEPAGQLCYALLYGRSGPCPGCPAAGRAAAVWDGKPYWISTALPSLREQPPATASAAFLFREALLRECAALSSSKDRAGAALDVLLCHLEDRLSCQGTCLLEVCGARSLRRVSPASVRKDAAAVELPDSSRVRAWREALSAGKPVWAGSAAGAAAQIPGLASLLPRADSRRLLVAPLFSRKKLSALWLLGDPPENAAGLLEETCLAVGQLLSPLLKLYLSNLRLGSMGYRDPTTGARNFHALERRLSGHTAGQAAGAVMCDILCLNQVNDALGHDAGDQFLLNTYQQLHDAFRGYPVYRVGGDEFLVLCEGVPEEEFTRLAEGFRQKEAFAGHRFSLGSAWDGSGGSLWALIRCAARRMRKGRDAFLREAPLPAPQGGPGGRWQAGGAAARKHSSRAFLEFLGSRCFDLPTFLRSLSKPDSASYFYFGDLQEDLFFLTDHLRDDFSFPGNLVHSFSACMREKVYLPDRERFDREIALLRAEERQEFSTRYRVYGKSGQLFWVHCHGAVCWEGGQPVFLSGSLFVRTTEEDSDPVTGFSNTRTALSRLSLLLQEGKPLMAVAFAPRDFSNINRIFGRKTGNDLLYEISNRLVGQLGGEFRFFRLEGLCFLAVSQSALNPREPVRIIRETVAEAYARFNIQLVYPAAVGVIYAPQDVAAAQELVDAALASVQAAREMPDLEYFRFSARMAAASQEEADLALALNHSINQGFRDFRLVIQPQVMANEETLFGGELLLRWKHNGADVPAGRFIPVLEQHGLILPVGKWVAQQAVRLCKRISERLPPFKLSFNVSGLQLLDPSLAETLRTELRETGAPGHNLLAELTETYFQGMSEQLSAFVGQCKEMGISLALDDFGSAYSGLQFLLRYPSAVIKLDRELMREITTSSENVKFMMSLVYACHCFGRAVCAEGVETAEELRIVRLTGCDLIQGFYFYRPMELSDFFRRMDAGEWDAPPARKKT